MDNLLSMKHLSTDQINGLLNAAEEFSQGRGWTPDSQTFAVNLFFEPSTRTKTSFEVAERKLGLDVVPFETAGSSLLKGETMEDTLKTLEAIGVNVAVIRHSEEAFYESLMGKTGIKLINAGDGCGQHPTQCLLDLYTIKQEFGRFEGLKIGIVGDLRHSRVAHSNAEALTSLGAEVFFSGPSEWFENESHAENYQELDQVVEKADALIMLRIQHERHDHRSLYTKEEYHARFGLTLEREKKMKAGSIIMHPGPVNRGVEIADALVEGEKSRIFRQIENGVYTRMAVLQSILTNRRVHSWVGSSKMLTC